jgi:hypothetical protein
MPSLNLINLPREILARIVHDPDLTIADRKSAGKTCKALCFVDHDEVAYRQLVRRTTGVTTLPPTAGGSWETQFKHFVTAPQKNFGIDDRRMTVADRDALYDEFSNQEGWD